MSMRGILRSLVTLPKVSRSCKFYVSNIRQKSVFEKYVEFQMENKNRESHVIKKTVNDELNTKNLNSDDEIQETVLNNKNSDSVSKQNEMLNYYEDENLKYFKSEGIGEPELNSDQKADTINLQDTRQKSVFEKYVEFQIENKNRESHVIKERVPVNDELNTKNLKNDHKNQEKVSNNKNSDSVSKQYQMTNDASSLLKFILSCELIQDTNSTLNSKDYLLFHEYLKTNQSKKIPWFTDVLMQTSTANTSNNTANTRYNTANTRYNTANTRYNTANTSNNTANTRYNTANTRYNTANTRYNTKDLNTILRPTILVQKYLSGEKYVEISPDMQGYLNSIKHVIESIDKETIKLVDTAVYHPILHYKGNSNFIAVYRHRVCLICLRIPKKNYCTPHFVDTECLGAVAILGAINTSLDPRFKELPPVNNALIVFVDVTGKPAKLHFIHERMVNIYWNKWLNRLYNYWSKVII